MTVLSFFIGKECYQTIILDAWALIWLSLHLDIFTLCFKSTESLSSLKSGTSLFAYSNTCEYFMYKHLYFQLISANQVPQNRSSVKMWITETTH